MKKPANKNINIKKNNSLLINNQEREIRLFFILILVLGVLLVAVVFQKKFEKSNFKNFYGAEQNYLQTQKKLFVGIYSTETKSNLSQKHLVKLELKDDFSAVMTHEYQDKKEEIVYKGNWSAGYKGDLIVSLQIQENKQLFNFMLGEENKKELILVDPDLKIWGKNGLTLKKL